MEDFHDCEYQDAAEGFDEDLDLGEEVPQRPLTPGVNPLVSKLLYVYVCCNVVLFWTFSRVYQRSFCLAGCAHSIHRGMQDRVGGEADPAGPPASRLGSCGGSGRGVNHEPGLLRVGCGHHTHDRQGENFFLFLGLHSPYFSSYLFVLLKISSKGIFLIYSGSLVFLSSSSDCFDNGVNRY